MANLTPASFPGFTGEKTRPLLISSIIYHKIIEDLHDHAIILLDNKGTIQSWNKGAEKVTGYKAGEIIGKNLRVFYTPEDRTRNLPDTLLTESAQHGKAQFEGWNMRKNGSFFRANIQVSPFREKDGEIVGFSKVIYDLSRQKQSELSIALAMIEGQEKEKQDISSQLHDKVAQTLASALVLLQNAGKEGRNSFILESEYYLQSALEEVKDLSRRISPETVLSSNLPAAIREYIDKIKSQRQIKIRFTCVPKVVHIEKNLQLLLYRMVQEQMGNILQHAQATDVTIDLRNQKKKVTMTVTDNGNGFDPGIIKNGPGIEKIVLTAGLYSGIVEFFSAPAKGCTLKITIPIKAGDKNRSHPDA